MDWGWGRNIDLGRNGRRLGGIPSQKEVVYRAEGDWGPFLPPVAATNSRGEGRGRVEACHIPGRRRPPDPDYQGRWEMDDR